MFKPVFVRGQLFCKFYILGPTFSRLSLRWKLDGEVGLAQSVILLCDLILQHKTFSLGCFETGGLFKWSFQDKELVEETINELKGRDTILEVYDKFSIFAEKFVEVGGHYLEM